LLFALLLCLLNNQTVATADEQMSARQPTTPPTMAPVLLAVELLVLICGSGVGVAVALADIPVWLIA
jgi:hypothetical protein